MVINHEKNSKSLFKHQLLVTCVFVLAIILITISGSFAIFSKTASGNEYNVVQVGELELSYVDLSEEGNVLTLASGYPTSDEVGSSSVPYRFSVENTGTLKATYTVKVIDDTDTIKADGCEDKLMDSTYLRYKFDNQEPATLNGVKNAEGDGYIVYTGTLEPFESNIHEIRLWINENSPNSMLGKHFHGKVVIEIVQATGNDGLTRPEGFRIAKVFANENLGENCKTYDDGVDTFLVGQCQNNYVWYSGKLWRVVLKNNETGAVKMVTDNAITTISYNQENQTNFKNSYADQWLSQEFLPTLYNYVDYLVVDNIWDVTLDDLEAPSRPVGTTTVQRTIGLLNAYEYYTTYNKSDGLATSESGYLNNGTSWWLITPHNVSESWTVMSDGLFESAASPVVSGIRPSVNLKSEIHITSGSGTQSNPYRLMGDVKKAINGTTLLSTRDSGEYITFNNELYRIVGIENNLTKIIAVDTPELLSSKEFDNSSNFANASIKTDLETYYQNNIVEPYKAMVEPNQTWYLGALSETNYYHYKSSICKTINAEISASTCERTDAFTTASIGIPRIGEMFTSQITRRTKTAFFMLTSLDSSTAVVASWGGAFPTSMAGAKPSMYLKAGVRIAKNNTGDGTYERPYTIELSA